MDYEEKYKKSLDRAVNLFVTNNISATAVCEIFPELNESEEVNYEKKYKEALERAKKMQENSNGMILKKWLWGVFPELKESEDEKIRKAIHIYLDWLDGRKDYAPKGGYSIKDMIAWLEKQGEKKPEVL